MSTKREFLHKLVIPTWLLIVAVLLLVGRSTTSAAPATFTVTNTNDSGAGSLRQAIIDANSNGNPSDMDTIEFDIPGSGPHTITATNPATMDVTQQVTIDGYTQSGANVNTAANPQPMNGTITVELEGAQNIQYGIGFVAGSAGSIIKGMSIFNFDQAAIQVGANDVSVQGNYLNVKADGLTPADGGSAGAQGDGASSGMQVGGVFPAERNIIAGFSAGSSALALEGEDSVAYGNYVGVGKDGIKDMGVRLGVGIAGNNVAVGGTSTAQRNVISGTEVAGVVITGGAGSVVQGNYIGPDYTGNINSEISNGAGVIITAGASGNLIGGTGANEGNTIKGVSGAGVSSLQLTINGYGPLVLISEKNAILGNTISQVGVFSYPGFGASNQGIDHFKQTDTSDPADFVPDEFEGQGVDQNDASDADTGGNGMINYPILKTAQQTGNQLEITYDLDAADSPTDRYRVEFFASNERSIFGYGPGETYLGAATSVEPGTDRTVTLTVDADVAGEALSATTTAIDAATASGFGSTSEFAQNISIGSAADFDADGIPDSVEDGAPNNGDGNNDGIADKLQPTTTSYVTAEVNGTNIYATLMTEGCSENGTVSSLNASSLQAKDNGYTYPYGLADFTLYCSRGDTVNVTMYVHADSEPERYIPRKYNPNENRFYDIPGSSLTTETLGESTALKLTYSAQDGGDLDDDEEENGIIVDPVGLATEQAGTLANTGTLLIALIPTGLLLILGAVYTYIDYRKHKKPLKEADPFAASTYTYWHHLKVVAIPMAKYRVQFTFEKKQELSHIS